MNDLIRKTIAEQYGIAIDRITDAPRQFVAETYILDCQNIQYFCKIVTKPLFIRPIVESLPILKSLHEQGMDRAAYPIPTQKGDLYLRAGNALIVLFNYIAARQSEAYDYYSFGELIARVHSMTAKIHIPIPQEKFVYRYADTFPQQLEQIVKGEAGDAISRSLTSLVTKYNDEIHHDYDSFMSLRQELRGGRSRMVITHGDPGGNTLVKSPTDLYLIDWDSILLAPPERDTWFFVHEPEFIRGYRSHYPEYHADPALCRYFTYKRYFEDLVEYFTEIRGDGTEEHRRKNLTGLQNDCFEGWLRPAIRRFDPLS